MQQYEARRELNEASRTYAEHHAEIWEAHEVELLVECWADAHIDEIAETLGRTIEACRQKYYELGQAKERATRTKQTKSATNSKWDRGWTSLEDMGF